jgi:uncharacterized membrane protein
MSPRAWISGRADVLIVAAIACLSAAVVVLAPSLTPLRAVCGILLVLAAPGYALVMAMFGDERPEVAMQIVLSLALSIALCIAAALGLNAAGVELTARSFTLALAGIALAAAAVATVRRREGAVITFGSLAAMRAWAVPLALVVGVFAGVLVALRQPLPNPDVQGYTALSATRTAPSRVNVAVRNEEHEVVRYHVQILGFTPDAGFTVIGRSDAQLAPGERWRHTVSTVPAGVARPLKVRLYRAGAPDKIYRSVYLQP